MSRRHIMHDVEEKGFDHTKPHRPNKATIRLFKGANVDDVADVEMNSVDDVQISEPVLRSGFVEIQDVEPALPVIEATSKVEPVVEMKVEPEQPEVKVTEKKQKQKPKKKSLFKADVPEAD